MMQIVEIEKNNKDKLDVTVFLSVFLEQEVGLHYGWAEFRWPEAKE